MHVTKTSVFVFVFFSCRIYLFLYSKLNTHRRIENSHISSLCKLFSKLYQTGYAIGPDATLAVLIKRAKIYITLVQSCFTCSDTLINSNNK